MIEEKKKINSDADVKKLQFTGKATVHATTIVGLMIKVDKTAKKWLVSKTINRKTRKETFATFNESKAPSKVITNFASAKIEAQIIINKMLGFTDTTNSTMDDIFSEYIRRQGLGRKKRLQSTEKDYYSNWNQFPEWFKQMKTEKLNVKSVENLIDSLCKKYPRDADSSLQPRINQLMKLTWGLNTIVRNEYKCPEKDPNEILNGFKYTGYRYYKEEKALDEDIAKKLLKYVLDIALKEPASCHKETKDKAPLARHACASAMCVLILTGCRLNEIRELTFANEVDFIKDDDGKVFGGILNIPESRTKTRVDYDIAFSQTVSDILMKFRERNTHDTVFSNKGATPVHYSTFRRFYNELEREFGVRIKARTMRTTFVSLAFKYGIQEAYIMKQTSHRSGKNILHKHYLKLDDVTRVGVMQQYEDRLLSSYL